jgi:hypothetical protein
MRLEDNFKSCNPKKPDKEDGTMVRHASLFGLEGKVRGDGSPIRIWSARREAPTGYAGSRFFVFKAGERAA